MKILIFTCVFFLSAGSMVAQDSPVGIWKTVDDDSGKALSKVEIYEDNGTYFGKIIDLLEDDDSELCTECKGEKHNQPIVGLVIIEDLKPHKDYWKSGTILDPGNGNQYRCSVWFEEGQPDELKVRGKHWTGLYRTQTWLRVK